MRDDFPVRVKKLLAERVGVRCANPDCQKVTSGPGADPGGSVNIGVAAHIAAASPGGPRYDPEMDSEERKSAGNGIWLCENCAKLIDSDPQGFTSDGLYEWKTGAENRASESIRGISGPAVAAGASPTVALLTTQLDQLAGRLSGETEQRLELMRQAWREGSKEEVINV